jgi:bis(5'-nucleosyl)-tetraphosphatase (symmetrical)
VSARRIFIGDIQGCRGELEALLELVRYDPGQDELLPVGDLVNRGPDSLGALRLLVELGAKPVLGNHDLHCLRVARGLREVRPTDTLEALLAAEDREPLLAWLAAQPFVRCFPDVVLVHAGIHPQWSDPGRVLAAVGPLEPQPASDFATRARYCSASGERPPSDWPAPPLPYRPWYDVCVSG